MPAHSISHPVFARFYAQVSPAMDSGGMAARRQQLLQGLTGAVIEIGAGNGLNFAHYPAGVTRVLAVEPDPFLREIARNNAASAPDSVEVADGVAEDLPAGDATFHAAVATLVLCSVGASRPRDTAVPACGVPELGYTSSPGLLRGPLVFVDGAA